MVAEVFAGLSAIKTAFDIAKGLKDIDDATRRNAAVIELQEKILVAQQQQATLIETVSNLEKEVADLKTWNSEKERYELKSVYIGSFAYLSKPDAQNAEPPHWLCAACYNNDKKSLLQDHGRDPHDHMTSLYRCQRKECGSTIRVPWDVNPAKPYFGPA